MYFKSRWPSRLLKLDDPKITQEILDSKNKNDSILEFIPTREMFWFQKSKETLLNFIGNETLMDKKTKDLTLVEGIKTLKELVGF